MADFVGGLCARLVTASATATTVIRRLVGAHSLV